MGTIFSATNATSAMTTAAGDISPYVIALFALLAGLTIAIAWFKRGVRGVKSGNVK